jgi:signal transduction histidine kinase
MKNIEQQFRDEIEVERLWVVTGHGQYVFFSMLLVSGLLVFGLWDTATQKLLLSWFLLLTAINFCKWMVLSFYHRRKEALSANRGRFKGIILAVAVMTGLCWGLCVIWFMTPAQPLNVLLISLTLIIEIVGAMLTWTCYLPAVIAISVPPALPLVSLLLLQGGQMYAAAALILAILTVLGVVSSLKLAETLNQALILNFENVALRRESEEKSVLLETALENMSQGISMTDSDDRLRMWNRQFVRLLGPAGERVAADAHLASILQAADPPLAMTSEDRSEYRLAGGQVYEIRQSKLAQGGRVLTFTDISDLNKREQALEKARKEAEQANAAKTRFLAAASHDLRQPIHALGLFFAELSDRVHGPETARVIGQIDDAIATINSMLNALLDISKLDAGVVKPAVEPLALAGLFARLQTEFQTIAWENRNDLHFRPAGALVETDPAMLERMLRNLIGNALRYTENGRILVGSRRRGDRVEIQVIDNGPGIPEDQLDDIFIEFHQLQNPARDRRQGLGLGLAIVKRLAALLGHEIKVASRRGRGSCFSITLPLARPMSAPAPGQSYENAYSPGDSLSGRQVLVVDDDTAVLAGMEALLTRWGCRVITAASPAEAEEKLAAHGQPPELLIVDYRLPGTVSGIDFARRLQAGLDYPLEVLVVTGDTGPERLRDADASGYPLLHKPVQPAKLRSTLHYLTGKLMIGRA